MRGGGLISLSVVTESGNFTGLPVPAPVPVRCLVGLERLVADRVRVLGTRLRANGDEQPVGERRIWRDGDGDVGCEKSVAVSPWWRWGEKDATILVVCAALLLNPEGLRSNFGRAQLNTNQTFSRAAGTVPIGRPVADPRIKCRP